MTEIRVVFKNGDIKNLTTGANPDEVCDHYRHVRANGYMYELGNEVIDPRKVIVFEVDNTIV